MKVDWKKEFDICLEIARKNKEEGVSIMSFYWDGRADGVRWLGEQLDNCNDEEVEDE